MGNPTQRKPLARSAAKPGPVVTQVLEGEMAAADDPANASSDAMQEVGGSSTTTVTAVLRAMQLIDAFALGESHLPLAELSRRCGLHKTTALRIARTLAQSGYLVAAGRWRLAPGPGSGLVGRPLPGRF